MTHSRRHGLTRRQWHYAKLVARGLSTAEIAKQEDRVPRAVLFAVRSIHKAWGTKTRLELIERYKELQP